MGVSGDTRMHGARGGTERCSGHAAVRRGAALAVPGGRGAGKGAVTPIADTGSCARGGRSSAEGRAVDRAIERAMLRQGMR
jgi:hypothetical protein